MKEHENNNTDHSPYETRLVVWKSKSATIEHCMEGVREGLRMDCQRVGEGLGRVGE